MLSRVDGKKPPLGVRLIGIAHIAVGVLFVGFATITISSCLIGLLFVMGSLVGSSFDVVNGLPGAGGVLGSPTVGSVAMIGLGTFVTFFGINAGIFIVGLVSAEIGNALFKGTEWARVAILIFMTVKLIGGGIIAIVAPYLLVLVALDIFMLDYFRKPHVKEYFVGAPIENSLKKLTVRLKKGGVEDISTEKDEDGKSFSLYGFWETGKVSTPKEKLQNFSVFLGVILWAVFFIWYSETHPNDGSLEYELIRVPGLLIPAASIAIIFYCIASSFKKFRTKVTS